MSGRIYDSGINPKCDICGSKMWTSSDTNFNGCQCKRKGCKGNQIYDSFDTNYFKGSNIKFENGNYMLEGKISTFSRAKSKYTIFERFKNFIFTIKEKCK